MRTTLMQFSHDKRGSGWVGTGYWVMEGFKKKYTG